LAHYLKGKVAEIEAANPWVRGKLIRTGLLEVSLTYPTATDGDGDGNSAVHPSSSFYFVEDETLTPTLPFDALQDCVQKYVVPSGAELVDNASNAPLFKVTLVVTSPSSVAVVVSLSHMVADGFTFYEVYKMLSMDGEIKALTAAREYQFESWISSIGKGGAQFIFSAGSIARLVSNILLKEVEVGINSEINLEHIASLKAEYSKHHSSAGGATYISTNDILTSWFLRRTSCDIGFMAVNFRNRCPLVTDTHAGNYEGLIVYQKDDFASPELIRHSVLSPDFSRQVTGPFPSFLGTLKAKLTNCSSWVTFYHHNILPRCTHVYHTPILGKAGRAPFDAVGVFYKSNQHQICMIAATGKSKEGRDVALQLSGDSQMVHVT
jgi:hypothetical protein